MAANEANFNETKGAQVSEGQANGLRGNDLESGAALGRQISVTLTPEQFETLYLQPGGTQAKGGLSKILGNPTPLGIATFLLCLTPVSCDLMRFRSTDSTSLTTGVGSYYGIGGLGLIVAGIMEWALGNTFPFVVFFTFGGFWLNFGFLNSPIQAISTAFVGGAANPQLNGGIAIYLVIWGCLVFFYLITALRTNLVFVVLFFVLDVAFFLLAAAYYALAKGKASHAISLLRAGGVFGFLTCMCGWYLLFVLLLGSTGFPFTLPIGDLSGFLSGKKRRAD